MEKEMQKRMRAFEDKVRKYIQELKMINPGDRLLVAVSGGMDSMALLHYLFKYRTQLGIEVFAVHVDHMLRGEQSEGDRLFVEAFCKERGIKIFSRAIPIPAILDAEQGNSQAICRRERYQYFEEIMGAYDLRKLVTAHHADDQLESVLMALTKGAIMKGIQGIRCVRSLGSHGVVIRPLLAVTKEEIRLYLKEQGISYREDASNAKDAYLRNRLRHHVLPLLKAESEAVSTHAVHLTKNLQEDAAYLMEQAERLFPSIVLKLGEHMYSMEIDAFQKVPVALQKRIILILLNYIYNKSNTIQSYTVWTSILKLCDATDGSAEVHLPEGFKAVRSYNQLRVFKEEAKRADLALGEVPLNQWIDVGRKFRLYIGKSSETVDNHRSDDIQVYYFSTQELSLPFVIRMRQEGDRIALKGMSKPKRLSRLFIDEKIPLMIRDSLPILATLDNEVIAVIGVRVSNYFSEVKRLNDDMVLMFSASTRDV